MWAEHVVMKHDVLVNAGQQQPHYTVCPKKVSPLTFCNNNRKSAPI